jgi:hypothetical protein
MGALDYCDLSIGVEVGCHGLRRDRRPTGGAKARRHGSSNARRIRTSAMASRPPCGPLELAGGPAATCPPADTSCQESRQSRAVECTRQRCLHGSLPHRPRSACCVAQGVEKLRRPRLGMGQCAGRNDARRVQQAVGTDASSRRGLARWREPGWVLCVALPLPEQPS